LKRLQWTSKGEIIDAGVSAMLPSNDMIDLERPWMKFSGQLAILAVCTCALPNLADEIGVQFS
jgi:hypothetical protein